MQPVEGDGAAELVPRYTVTLLPRAGDRSLGPHAAHPAAAAYEANGCRAADGAPTRPMGRDGAGPGAAVGAEELASLQRLEASSPIAHSAPSAATPLANGAHAGMESSAGAGPAAAASACEGAQHGAMISSSPGHAAADGGSNLGISAPVCNGVRHPGADSEPGAGAAAAAAAQQAQQPGGEAGTGEALSAAELAEAAAAARAFAAVEAATTGVPRFPGDDLPATSAVC